MEYIYSLLAGSIITIGIILIARNIKKTKYNLDNTYVAPKRY